MPCYEEIIDTPEGGIDTTTPGGDDDPSPPTSKVSIYNAEVTDKVSGGQSLKFQVGVYPINFSAIVSVNYATVNGTGIAGTHYQGTSGTLNIPIGESEGVIEVDTIGNFSNIQPRQFTVHLSTPVNCTIADADATGTIRYEQIINGGTQDPLNAKQFQSIRTGNRKIQDQFAKCSTRNQCTAWAMASYMAVQCILKDGLKRGFDGPELFTGSGGSPCSGSNCTCTTWYDYRVHDRTQSTGMRRLDIDGNPTSVRRKIGAVWEITSSTFTGSTTDKKNQYIRKIKKAIYETGAVYVTSVWYSTWNSASVTKTSPVMKEKSGWPSSTTGHAYIFLGWDDTKYGGSFIVQNDFGTRWGDGGWGYMPYGHLKDTWNGTRFRRTSSQGYPWIRVFRLTYKG